MRLEEAYKTLCDLKINEEIVYEKPKTRNLKEEFSFEIWHDWNAIHEEHGFDTEEEAEEEALSYIDNLVEQGYDKEDLSYEISGEAEEVEFLEENLDEDDPNVEFRSREEAVRYWNENHTDDPVLADYDDMEDWLKDSEDNGYIKEAYHNPIEFGEDELELAMEDPGESDEEDWDDDDLDENLEARENTQGTAYIYKFGDSPEDIEKTLAVYLAWEGIIGYNDDILDFKGDPEGLRDYLEEEGIIGYTYAIGEILDGEPAASADMDEEDFKVLSSQLGYITEGIECKKLEEAIPEEDKADDEMLRGIYAKIQQKSNAKLSPEEKDILNKYDLEVYRGEIIKKSTNNYEDRNLVFSNRLTRRDYGNSTYTKTRYKADPNVNYADRARKLRTRDAAIRTVNMGSWDDDINDKSTKPFYSDSKKYGWRPQTFQQKKRQEQTLDMSDKVRRMKNALSTRKQKEASLSNMDSEFDEKRTKALKDFETKLADIERSRKLNKEWDERDLEKAKSEINSLLSKNKE